MSFLGSVRTRVIALAGVIVVLLAVGGVIVVTHASAQSSSGTSGSGGATQTGAHSSSSSAPKVPLTVESVTPSLHQQGVVGTAPIKIQLSTALAASSPLPKVVPAIAGSWKRLDQGDLLEFVPSAGFAQLTRVRVRIPAGATGLQAADGETLAKPDIMRFRVGQYSSARLGQLLAQLGYLPVTWAPSSGSAPSLSDATAQLDAAYSPPAGSYTWKAGYPQRLHRFWDNASPNGLIIHGAVMAFESDHDLTMDGDAGRQVWKALLKAAASDDQNKHGYTYAVASQHDPETLTVWHDGKIIFHQLANTGIPAAPTTVGTDPVYLKYRYQVMKGLNPDGSKYADPVWWVSYFRSGEAVHYFDRGAYGYRQSLGCVELPYAPAKRIWPYLTYGTLVTVTPL